MDHRGIRARRGAHIFPSGREGWDDAAVREVLDAIEAVNWDGLPGPAVLFPARCGDPMR